MTTLEDKIKQVMELDFVPSVAASKEHQVEETLLEDNKEQVQTHNLVLNTEENVSMKSKLGGGANLRGRSSPSPRKSTPSPRTGSPRKSTGSPRISSPRKSSVSPRKKMGTKSDSIKQLNGQGSPRRSISPTKKKHSPRSSARRASTPTRSRLYEKALEQRAHLEKKREEAQKELSFSPKLVSSKKLRNKGATTPGRSRYDMLYESGKMKKNRLEQEAEKRRAHPDGCTFSPEVNASKRKSASKSQHLKRSDQLYANAKTLEAKKKAMAKEVSRQEMSSCSFTPEITKKAKAKRAASPGPSARMTEMYREHKEREDRLNSLRGKRELEACTFKPSINRRRKSDASGVPSAASVQERLTQYQHELERKKAEIKAKQAEELKKECTFKPEIKSRPPTPQRGRGPTEGAIHERLFHEAKQKKERQSELKGKHEQAAPKPRPSSARRSRPGEASVFDRLATPKKTQAGNDKTEDLAVRELEECTFQPNALKTITNKKSSPGAGVPCWERLHRESKEVKEVREEMKARQEKSTSVVKLRNSVGGTGKPIWERLNEDGKKVKDKAEERERERMAQEMAECTFKPQISVDTPQKAGTPIWDRLAASKAVGAAPSSPPSSKKTGLTYLEKVAQKSAAKKHATPSVQAKAAPPPPPSLEDKIASIMKAQDNSNTPKSPVQSPGGDILNV
uniref:Uncharacterized protein n=1 Tax=Mucochytrium quahogii TaxID=96639 RepID=A0A7S2RH79_9STRA|mmetsp:Transcript_7998/g.14655  ORF Transcript_7998/g.14655 Transcript_7998/m.14655 type:complete len:680 (-) Transcript_7998:594-2633(-)|eukprot:CAMPEP_0203746402 /NCGR_PEP_ID=MMETSP0098-20131031/1869_1 /ASSEMBLY_ACC=CAM_ASM_000208 /TAXON_ID=96639 /ORGANISM=" , Strain NY0313808BC1" /LENGTH=679 /DNA_ID=CAMNT_0050634507 /DNA_START=326 /DNA_END=2365 /DNA_ORIENTATION=-